MKALGCLSLLLFLAVIAAEIWVYILVSEALDDYLIVALLVVGLSFFGYRLTKWQAARLPQALMNNRMGQQGVAIFGAFLIALPGLISGSFGLLFQLPPVQSLFSKVAAKVLASMIKLAAERMGGKMPGGMGGMGGMPDMGAMGGMAGFPFPGMQPDQKLQGGKVIDAEKE